MGMLWGITWLLSAFSGDVYMTRWLSLHGAHLSVSVLMYALQVLEFLECP